MPRPTLLGREGGVDFKPSVMASTPNSNGDHAIDVELAQEEQDILRKPHFDSFQSTKPFHVVRETNIGKKNEAKYQVIVGQGSGSRMMNETDRVQRIQLAQKVDEECQAVFDADFNATWDGGALESIVSKDETVIYALPLIACMGGPFADAKHGNSPAVRISERERGVVGEGLIVLTKKKGIEHHNLIIQMSTKAGSCNAIESWSVLSEYGKEEKNAWAEYEALRKNDTYVGFINLGLSKARSEVYLPVQVQAHDTGYLKVVFGSHERKEPFRCANYFGCLFRLKKSCMRNWRGCVGRFSCCVREKFEGSWSFDAEFVKGLKEQIVKRIQAATGNTEYKFPDFEYMHTPEERAILMEFQRSITFEYYNYNTGEIQPCTVTVKPDIKMSAIVAFARKLHSCANEERGARQQRWFGNTFKLFSTAKDLTNKTRVSTAKDPTNKTRGMLLRAWAPYLACSLILLVILYVFSKSSSNDAEDYEGDSLLAISPNVTSTTSLPWGL